MSRRNPEYVDPFAGTEKGMRLQGVLPLTCCERLAAVLADARGEVRFQLHFVQAGSGRHRVAGKVEATVTLECQRCLGPFAVTLESEFELALVESEAGAERAMEQDGLEAVIVAERSLRIADLLEDELLLALPAVPRHAEGHAACRPLEFSRPEAVREAPKPANPFAILADLKTH
ncbi:MAG: DUF177 domain-containing protein [Thiotrichales bacterium]